MNIDEVKLCLQTKNIQITNEKRMNNNLGTRLETIGGCIVNIYDTGKVNCQGKNKESVEKILCGSTSTLQNRNVFVVYGHDNNARTQLEAMLRRWDLNPIILDQQISAGSTIIEKLEEYTTKASFGIVLATPDDVGYNRGEESQKKYRVRQNVVLELGMLLAKMGRSKVAILLSQSEEMERPSDIEGLIYIPFKDNVEEAKLSLAKELQGNGYNIDVGKL